MGEKRYVGDSVFELLERQFSVVCKVKRALFTAEQVSHWLNNARAVRNKASIIVNQAKESA
ncbi:unnamed protein product [Dicrocoelium dendriticum]|nr:unnamed protein product [Dicrocoelium dendriticum]